MLLVSFNIFFGMFVAWTLMADGTRDLPDYGLPNLSSSCVVVVVFSVLFLSFIFLSRTWTIYFFQDEEKNLGSYSVSFTE